MGIKPQHQENIQVKQRKNQKGHLNSKEKTKLARGRINLSKIRAAARNTISMGPETHLTWRAHPTNKEVRKIFKDLKYPTNNSIEAKTRWLVALEGKAKETKTEYKKIQLAHDANEKFARYKKKNEILRLEPKKAHIYIFSNSSHTPYERARLSTGEITTDPQLVKHEAGKYFLKTSRAIVDPERAEDEPWGVELADGLDPISIEPPYCIPRGETSRHVHQRHLRHVSSQTNGIKSRWVDNMPNEIIKSLPEEFHNAQQ